MFNFRDNKYKQSSSYSAAAKLMRTDLTVCITWITVAGIIVYVHEKPVP